MGSIQNEVFGVVWGNSDDTHISSPDGFWFLLKWCVFIQLLLMMSWQPRGRTWLFKCSMHQAVISSFPKSRSHWGWGGICTMCGGWFPKEWNTQFFYNWAVRSLVRKISWTICIMLELHWKSLHRDPYKSPLVKKPQCYLQLGGLETLWKTFSRKLSWWIHCRRYRQFTNRERFLKHHEFAFWILHLNCVAIQNVECFPSHNSFLKVVCFGVWIIIQVATFSSRPI